MIFKATADPLDRWMHLVEITPPAVVPIAGDLISINELVGGVRGVFRVRQRLIWLDMVYLWVKLIDDEAHQMRLYEELGIPIVAKTKPALHASED